MVERVLELSGLIEEEQFAARRRLHRGRVGAISYYFFKKKPLVSHDKFNSFISFPLEGLWYYFFEKQDFTNEAFCWCFLGHDTLCLGVRYSTLPTHDATNYLAIPVRKHHPWHLYSGMEVKDETDRGVKMSKLFTLPSVIPAKLNHFLPLLY